MPKIKGVCRNIDGCTKAQSKEEQEVEKSNFFCSECGKPLKEIKESQGNPGRFNWKRIMIIAIPILAIGGVVYGIYEWMNRDLDPNNDELWPPTDTIIQNRDSIPLNDSINASVDTLTNNGSANGLNNQTILNVNIYNGKDTVLVKDTILVTDTVLVDVGQKTQSSKTLRLSYGTYTGDIKNGYPHGQGTLKYTQRRQINRYDPKKRFAEPGQYVKGQFINGFVSNGMLYDKNGEPLENILVGVDAGGTYDSK